MTELTDKLEKFISFAHIQDFLYENELLMLNEVLKRLIKAEEDLEVCSDIISNAEF